MATRPIKYLTPRSLYFSWFMMIVLLSTFAFGVASGSADPGTLPGTFILLLDSQPIMQPQNLRIIDYGTEEVTLAWDPNAEPDLAGYRVYYKTGSSGPPYDGTGGDQGVSPIEVSLDNTFTITGLSNTETWYFVVTAFDNLGFESDYSNEVLTLWP